MKTFAIYMMFFLSGAAALIYQVVWVRSFSLVFGGSHLAVATVLTVFMGGLALGSYLIARNSHRCRFSMLKLYGYLELGIALSALLFMALISLYPQVYIFFAGYFPDSRFYLTIIRIVFASFAILVPTTLMGATLPVLSSFLTDQKEQIGVHVSLLYAVNTLGAVIGAASAGFVLLPNMTVSSTAYLAVAMNVSVGLACLMMKSDHSPTAGLPAVPATFDTGLPESEAAAPLQQHTASDTFVRKLITAGIAVSGFCALGYEVLWSRVLSIVIGASVYGFTIILVSFLSGISCGSLCYGYVCRLRSRTPQQELRKQLTGFGVVQLLIGICALIVSIKLLDLPIDKSSLMKYFISRDIAVFSARQFTSILLAFSYMFVPAFLMGIAFPMAGKIHAVSIGNICRATGDILSYNTLGAILGSAVSGFVLIYAVGIERSLQLLIVINIGLGLFVLATLHKKPLTKWLITSIPVVIIVLLATYPGGWRIWGQRWLAVYKANEMEGYVTPQTIKGMLAGTEVLYYGEGVEAIVSSVRTAEYQGFITNGRTESSNTPADLQCVYTLGHLPMLLAKDPKKVFVLGTGAGITLGATSVHPSVEKITLVEIEPKVLGVARTFGRYNHNVLDNPKLNIVFNDGRNFLLTTKERFDVITADPVHPWFSGAGYLYTDEYFKLASRRLNPGGIICQWVPIYELTEANLKSIFATFRKNFKYTMLWLTQYDAEMVGSNDPITLDEAELERRISTPRVKSDLASVHMGTARDFMSYFIMGNKATDAFSSGGIINSDQNVYLEFSAPLSMGKTELVARNIAAMTGMRESILAYIKPATTGQARAEQQNYWHKNMQAAVLKDQAQILYYTEGKEHAYFDILKRVTRTLPEYAAHRIMYDEYMNILNMMHKIR